ncbi:MAG: DUF4339 domain-containing protein [Verrucomicrobiota bacterium]
MQLIEGKDYYSSRNGEQFGPFKPAELAEMIMQKRVVRSDMLWCDGMDAWLSAETFPELAPYFPQPEPAPQQPAPPAAEPPPQPVGSETVPLSAVPLTAPGQAPAPGQAVGSQTVPLSGIAPSAPEQARNVQQGLHPLSEAASEPAPQSSNQVVKTEVGSTGALKVNRGNLSGKGVKRAAFQPGSRYRRWAGANFGVMLLCYIAAVIGMIIPFLAFFLAIDSSGDGNFESLLSTSMGSKLATVSFAVFAICTLIFIVMMLIYTYRMWAYINELPGIRTTPGKAVGFLFIPFFNIYWFFVAFYSWSTEYNRFLDESNQVGESNRVSEGLMLALNILDLLGFWLFTAPFRAHQMCKGINYLAQCEQPDFGYEEDYDYDG